MCIIGGSIAGNYLACLLREQDIGCIVIEKCTSFDSRPLQCAGIISQKLLDIVDYPLPSSLILNRVKKADIVSPDLSHIYMEGKENPVVIDRGAFDTFFGEKAQKMGAQYYFDEQYITHKKIKNSPYCKITTSKTTSERRIYAKIVVGADGPFSAVAKTFNVKNKNIPAAQARVKYDYDAENSAMYFNPLWKELFGYIVPEGKNGICRIGLATKKKPHLAFRKFLSILNVKDENIVSRQGGVIPYGFPKRFVFDHTVLIGDSACMVKATTGGGIVMLISAAQILSPAIVKSLKVQDFSEKFFHRNYQNPIKHGRIGITLRLHYFLRLIIARMKEYDYNYFFNIYQNTDLHKIIAKYADMDFPLVVMAKVMKNKYFIRFMIHVLFRNLDILIKFLHNVFKSQ